KRKRKVYFIAPSRTGWPNIFRFNRTVRKGYRRVFVASNRGNKRTRPWRKPKVLGLGSARPSLSPRLTYGWKRRHSIRILLHQDSSSLARAEHRAYAAGTRRSGFHQRVAGRDAGTGRSGDPATGALKFSGRIRCSQCGRCRRTFSGLSIPAVLFVRRLLPLTLGMVSDWSFSLCSMWNKSFLAFLSGCVSTSVTGNEEGA
ncbi:unnamed protein product, partial [Musa acuminata subsp. burmannicoides]